MVDNVVIGNWKMHGSRDFCRRFVAESLATLESVQGVEIGLCPPYPYIDVLQPMLAESPVAVGAQDLNALPPGAMTGEVCASMLQDMGCRYVLVGHSERRLYFDESDAVIAAKFDAAVAAGLVPVLCVGETLEQREAEQTLGVVSEQIRSVLATVGPDRFAAGMVAYEPVWAIGTGMTASASDAQAVHRSIRSVLREVMGESGSARMRILYGGSVKPENAANLFSQPDINGGLIGGASLDGSQFAAICAVASSIPQDSV